MNRIEKISATKKNALRSWLPSTGQSPEGEFKGKFYYPNCYLEAAKACVQLNKLGFNIKKAGISVAVEPYDVAEATALLSSVLSGVLVADMTEDMIGMRTTIPSYFLTLKPTKKNNSIPAYCTRTLTSAQIDDQTLPNGEYRLIGSIMNEIGAPAPISFIDEPPYCLYPQNPEELFPVPHHIIQNGMRAKLGNVRMSNEQHIAILAGIGKNSSKIVEGVYGVGEKQFDEVNHGSAVMILAMLAMALVDWGMKNPNKSLFIVSTARLTNDQDAPPSAYILNKILNQLGLNPDWVGMPIIRAGIERSHPTGAVIVEIKPDQYKETLSLVQLKFNAAVEKMVTGNPDLFS